jgi:hypothetical protein
MHTEAKRVQAEAALRRLNAPECRLEGEEARLLTTGAITVSIAEINEPLTAIGLNAKTGLLRLANQPPNVGGAITVLKESARMPCALGK